MRQKELSKNPVEISTPHLLPFFGKRRLKDFVREQRTAEYDLLINFSGLHKSGIFEGHARAKKNVGSGSSRPNAAKVSI